MAIKELKEKLFSKFRSIVSFRYTQPQYDICDYTILSRKRLPNKSFVFALKFSTFAYNKDLKPSLKRCLIVKIAYCFTLRRSYTVNAINKNKIQTEHSFTFLITSYTSTVYHRMLTIILYTNLNVLGIFLINQKNIHILRKFENISIIFSLTWMPFRLYSKKGY